MGGESFLLKRVVALDELVSDTGVSESSLAFGGMIATEDATAPELDHSLSPVAVAFLEVAGGQEYFIVG